MTSGASFNNFGKLKRQLEISNIPAVFKETLEIDEDSLPIIKIEDEACQLPLLKTKAQVANENVPQIKELIIKALNKLQGKGGTKEDIIAMVEVIYPQITTNSYMQRSLNLAFNKYLQVMPTRIKLLDDQVTNSQDDIYSIKNKEGGFCLKSAIVECFKGAELRASDNSLDFDTLKNRLLTKHAA